MFTLLFADLLLSHKLLRNELYTSRAVNAFLAVRVGTAFPGAQPSGLFFSLLPFHFFFFPFLWFQTDTHSRCFMLSVCHVPAVPPAAAPLACTYTIEGSTCAPLTPPIKLQQLTFNVESSISGAFKATDRGFFPSVALPDIALPEFTSLEFLPAQFLFMTQSKHTSFFPFTPTWIEREKWWFYSS